VKIVLEKYLTPLEKWLTVSPWSRLFCASVQRWQ